MRLAIADLATYLPPPAEHDTLLGSVEPQVYGHLFEPAGVHSRPPTVRRGVKRIACAPYAVPTAAVGERSTDLASRAAAQLDGGEARRVRTLLHAQCTLDQQIVGSACLRVQYEQFPATLGSAAVGQLGTAAVPTAMRLAALSLAADPQGLACVSAADKWLAPMVRKVPELVTYGDAAAACLLGAPDAVVRPLAFIDEVHTVARPTAAALWEDSAADQSRDVLALAKDAVQGLLARHPGLARDAIMLAGDGYGEAFDAALRQCCDIRGAAPGGAPAWHLSSAAPLFALGRVIDALRGAGGPRHAVVWSASAAGFAGAMLVSAADSF
jgi:hypothetical protein